MASGSKPAAFGKYIPIILSFSLLVISGCSVTGGLPESGAFAGSVKSRVPAAAPVVNNAIYSNDYIVDEGPVKSGGVRIYSTYPDTYNPLLTRNTYVSAMYGLVFESLARIGPGLTAEYGLAERWAPSVDGLVWHIVLRPDLKWHDGRPLTARDVKNTVEIIKGYGDQCPYAGLVENIESADALSDTEIKFTLRKENAYTPYCLTFPVMPSHIIIDSLDGVGGSNLSVALIGSGPYRFESFDGNRNFTLAISDTWRERVPAAEETVGGTRGGLPAGGGYETPPPYISALTFIYYDPAAEALSQFRSEKVDLFFSRTLNYNRYKSSSELEIRQYSEREFLAVALNCSKGITAAKSVRNALSRMIDRKPLIDAALNGRGIAAEFPVQPESSIYGAGIAYTPHDPQAARSILENAGFRMDDGVFYGDVGNGWHSLELHLLVNEGDADKLAVAESLARTYAGYGVIITVAPAPAEEVMQKVAAGDYEAALISYGTRPFPDMTGLYSFPWREGADQANPARYQNDEADRLAHELFTVYDESDRRTAFAELTSILQGDAPYIGICFRASSLVLGENMRGEISPNDKNPLNLLENWYIADYR